MMTSRFAWVGAWGTFLWLAASAASAVGWFPLDLIEQLFLLSPLITVPLGLSIMTDAREFRSLPSWTPWVVLVAGTSALVAFMFPRGTVSGVLTSFWALMTFGAGIIGLHRLLRYGLVSNSHSCFAAACLYLPVGGLWLVASRLGITPMGFEEPIVLLTGVHFHNSGFSAPILVGAAAGKFQGIGERKALRVIAVGVLTTPAFIGAGFVFSPALKVFAAIWLALSLVGLSILMLPGLRAATPISARLLLGVSACSVVAGMILSSVYAVGDFASREWISIPNMAVTHGILNGVGFVLCGLIGWCLAGTHKSDPRVNAGRDGFGRETQPCASRLPEGRDSSAVTWRDGWSN